MNKITNERLDELIADTDGMSMPLTRSALLELKDHREAFVADEDRIKQAVMQACSDVIGAHDSESIRDVDWMQLYREVASLAAQKLASAARVDLTLEERGLMEVLASVAQDEGDKLLEGALQKLLKADTETKHSLGLAALRRVLKTRKEKT